MSTHSMSSAHAAGAAEPNRLPLVTLVLGCASIFMFASFPWLPLILGLVTLGVAVAARRHIATPHEATLVTLGAILGLASVLLFWMTPGFHTIIWGY